MMFPSKKYTVAGMASAVLLINPLVTQAVGLLIECSENRVHIGYHVAENEECTASRKIVIYTAEGTRIVGSHDAFIVNSTDGATVELNAGESGEVSAEMTCEPIINGEAGAFQGDANAVKTKVFTHFEEGCAREEADFGVALRPELNEALDTILDEVLAPIVRSASALIDASANPAAQAPAEPAVPLQQPVVEEESAAPEPANQEPVNPQPANQEPVNPQQESEAQQEGGGNPIFRSNESPQRRFPFRGNRN